MLCDHRPRVALLAVGVVFLVRGGVAEIVGLEYCTTKVVTMQVGEGRAAFHRDTLAGEGVVLDDRAAAEFIVGKGIEVDGAAGGALDPLPVSALGAGS